MGVCVCVCGVCVECVCVWSVCVCVCVECVCVCVVCVCVCVSAEVSTGHPQLKSPVGVGGSKPSRALTHPLTLGLQCTIC